MLLKPNRTLVTALSLATLAVAALTVRSQNRNALSPTLEPGTTTVPLGCQPGGLCIYIPPVKGEAHPSSTFPDGTRVAVYVGANTPYTIAVARGQEQASAKVTKTVRFALYEVPTVNSDRPGDAVTLPTRLTLPADSTARLNGPSGSRFVNPGITFDLNEKAKQVTLTFPSADDGPRTFLAVLSGRNAQGRSVQASGLFVVTK